MRDNIKMDLKSRLWERELHGTSSELNPLPGLSEHSSDLKNEFALCTNSGGPWDIGLYIDGLFNDAINSPEYIAWNGWMSGEELIGKNMEGRVRDVIAILSWDFPGATLKPRKNPCNYVATACFITPDGPTQQSRMPTRHDVCRLRWLQDLRTHVISSQVPLQFEKIRNCCRCVSVHGAYKTNG
jgi:hypothetical protein